jgi:divalent metal cation (Fe/Co/Zn/Cd) transporter
VTGPDSGQRDDEAAAAYPGAMAVAPAMVDIRRKLARRAQLLAAASVAYNLIEACVALVAGGVAGSIALVAFGIDSLLEVSSGAVILWQFRHPQFESRERLAGRLISVCFFALAAYVTVGALSDLIRGNEADASSVGIALACASLAIMPFLAWAQRRTGRSLGSSAVVADSKQTALCTYMSGVLLVGLVVNAWLGWWWADPAAALIIAAVAVREGVSTWRGDNCCVPVARPAPACACDDC